MPAKGAYLEVGWVGNRMVVARRPTVVVRLVLKHRMPEITAL